MKRVRYMWTLERLAIAMFRNTSSNAELYVSESARTTGNTERFKDRSDILITIALPASIYPCASNRHDQNTTKGLSLSQISPSFLTLNGTCKVETARPGYDSAPTDPGKGGKKPYGLSGNHSSLCSLKNVLMALMRSLLEFGIS